MVQFLPEWEQDKDYHVKHAVYKQWCGIANDTIKLPARPIFRDLSDDESPMETAGLDDRFSDGDGEIPPHKRAKLPSATELFPPIGNARKHPPAAQRKWTVTPMITLQ